MASLEVAAPAAGKTATEATELLPKKAPDTSQECYDVLRAVVLGNILEFYDFGVLGYFSKEVGTAFFPSEEGDKQMQVLWGTIMYGTAFVARPLGGLALGLLSDTVGRQRALEVSIGAMAVATFLLGVVPPFSMWGYFSTVIVILLRMLQGLSAGGEIVSGGVFMAESAPSQSRCFFVATCFMGATIGFIIACASKLMVDLVFEPETAHEFGFRIPFLASSILGVAGLVAVKHAEEVHTEDSKVEESSLQDQLLQNWLPLVIAFFLTAPMAASCHFNFTFIATVETQFSDNPISTTRASIYTMISLAVYAMFCAFGGWLADRWGPIKVMYIGALLMVVVPYPALGVLMDGEQPIYLLAAQIVWMVSISFYVANLLFLIISMFPKAIRTSATALAFNLAQCATGGTINAIAASWIGSGKWIWLAIYLTILATVGVMSLIALKLFNIDCHFHHDKPAIKAAASGPPTEAA